MSTKTFKNSNCTTCEDRLANNNITYNTNNNDDDRASTTETANSNSKSSSDSITNYTDPEEEFITNDNSNSEKILNVVESTSSKASKKTMLTAGSRSLADNAVVTGASLLLGFIPDSGKHKKNMYKVKDNLVSDLTDNLNSNESRSTIGAGSSDDDEDDDVDTNVLSGGGGKFVEEHQHSKSHKQNTNNDKSKDSSRWWTFWNWGNRRRMMLTNEELKKMNKLMDKLRQQEIKKSTNKEISYDLIIENERGLILFGYPLFNKNMLISKFDPPPFTNIFNERVTISHSVTSTGSVSYNMNLIPIVNGSNWSWSWDKWHILMLNDDIDDQGWVYSAISFHSSLNWRGKYRLGDIVRKRYWIRAKQTKEVDEIDYEKKKQKQIQKKKTDNNNNVGDINNNNSIGGENKNKNTNREDQFFAKLQNLIIDRFKIEFIINELNKGENGLLRERIMNDKISKDKEFQFFEKIKIDLIFEQASVEILLKQLQKQALLNKQKNDKEKVYEFIKKFISYLKEELLLT